MDSPLTILEIKTLGHFSMSFAGKEVASNWPNETVKLLFCSLLSPLDLSFTWDRISRSVWDIPLTLTSQHQLEEVLVLSLKDFLIKELGFNPLISGVEGIKINQQRIHVDAHDFYHSALEGFRLSFRDEHAAALKKLNQAKSLYTGSYLPGLPGKIIINTRLDLDLFRAAVVDRVG